MTWSGHPQPDAARSPDPPESVGPAPSLASPWLLLAHILRPQGRKGEVLAELFTDVPDRFVDAPRVFLAKPGFEGSQAQARQARVLGFFLPVGKNSGRIVLALEGTSSIADAETLAGLDVLVPHEERLEPDEDSTYISDLLGCAVYDTSGDPDTTQILVGTVDDVHFPTTPDGTRRLEDAAPLLSVLSPTGAEILIPYVKAYLVSLDLAARRILMTLPPGLLEVNA